MTGLDPGLLGLIRDGGLVFGSLVLIWLLISERLVPAGRLKDALNRTERVEKVRDEALAGWKAQAQATKEVAEASRDALASLRGDAANRRTR